MSEINNNEEKLNYILKGVRAIKHLTRNGKLKNEQVVNVNEVMDSLEEKLLEVINLGSDETICTICQARQSTWMLNGDQIEYCGYCGAGIDRSDEE
ncbi:MAG: hypothetical protein RR565_04810 [Erysipelothrix sp.]